jgi:hypothetical protein
MSTLFWLNSPLQVALTVQYYVQLGSLLCFTLLSRFACLCNLEYIWFKSTGQGFGFTLRKFLSLSLSLSLGLFLFLVGCLTRDTVHVLIHDQARMTD